MRLSRYLATALVVAVGAIGVPAVASMMAPPSIAILAPATGSTVRGSTIPLRVAIHNYRLECTNMGKTNVPIREGHYHVMVDGMDMAHLVGPFCSPSVQLSGRGLAAGRHTITVVLATDAHAMASMPTSVTFNYQPVGTKPLPAPIRNGKPTVTVLSPRDGATVAKHFTLALNVRNFHLSCGLEGKRNIAGWGHIHVMVQQDGETSAAPATPLLAMMKTPMGMKAGKMMMMKTGMSRSTLMSMLGMAIPGMVGMPCTNRIPIDLSSWHNGPATIIVMLANNDHMPTMGAAPVVLHVNIR